MAHRTFPFFPGCGTGGVGCTYALQNMLLFLFSVWLLSVCPGTPSFAAVYGCAMKEFPIDALLNPVCYRKGLCAYANLGPRQSLFASSAQPPPPRDPGAA